MTKEEIEAKAALVANWDMFEHHMTEALSYACKLHMDIHFTGDLQHLIGVLKENKKEAVA